MKKIVHITNDLQRLGGVQRLLVDLMSLQKNEFNFEVILTRGENEYADELKALGVDVYHKRDLGFFGVIKRLNNADLVHTHLYPSIYIAYFTRTPTIVTEHNPHYRRRDILFVKTLERIIYKKFKKIVCISDGVKEKFLESIKVNPALTEVIHNGVDLSRFAQQPKAITADQAVIKLGMVGRFAPQKDIKSLIKLMTLLDSRFELHLAGDGALRPEYELLAKTLKVDNKIVFHGQVNNVPAFLNSLDIYIQSSHWEGFGIAVVEAMASGLPSFATNVEGLNHVVAKQHLFNVGDVDTLSCKISDLVSTAVSYEEESMNALVQAEKYSIKMTSHQHKSTYDEVLKHA
ncbi:glycosyltransferase [Pseudoalteromonas sp. Angola-7]|uniref:glycosyltransferase n=1 Tax=Pseudoalteromonas sp. Angola-7 TaxID=3025336 RepID=UPI0023593486|nr:glycosyltransferase [Pseudoalteromonas sp. Angola-7]MDC9529392.1 glycosyltransferase [Pseudoalteromonas sp. Angola-7]